MLDYVRPRFRTPRAVLRSELARNGIRPFLTRLPRRTPFRRVWCGKRNDMEMAVLPLNGTERRQYLSRAVLRSVQARNGIRRASFRSDNLRDVFHH